MTATRFTLFTVVDATVYEARRRDGRAPLGARWRLFEALQPVARAA